MIGPGPYAPAPAPRKSGAAKLVWAICGIVALLISGVTTAVTWPQPVALADPLPGAHVDAEESDPETAKWTAMNDALNSGDRAAFLDFATGDAQTALALWWDGTEAIGRSTAAISPWDDDTVYLGAQLAFAAHPERGSGSDDAGQFLLQGFYYEVTWDDDKFTSFVPSNEPMPWDEGPLYVARAENVVLFGAADEQALVDATLSTAQDGASRALGELRKLGASLPMEGFVVAVTDSQERLTRWQFGTDTPGWDMTVAGFAMGTYRPAEIKPWLDPTIATGDASGGTVSALGPASADQRLETFTHEFLHALHDTAVPISEQQVPISTTEGFAEWATAETGAVEEFYSDYRVHDAIRAYGTDTFSDEAMRSEDAWKGYASAASYYAFVQANGGNGWQLALDTRSEGIGLVEGALRQSPSFTADAWATWVLSN